jgi:hypothetical protein
LNCDHAFHMAVTRWDDRTPEVLQRIVSDGTASFTWFFTPRAAAARVFHRGPARVAAPTGFRWLSDRKGTRVAAGVGWEGRGFFEFYKTSMGGWQSEAATVWPGRFRGRPCTPITPYTPVTAGRAGTARRRIDQTESR